MSSAPTGHVRIPLAILARKDLGHVAAIVLGYLYDRQGEGGFAYPKLATMVRELPFGRSAISGAIRKLEDAGELRVVRRRERGRESLYQVLRRDEYRALAAGNRAPEESCAAVYPPVYETDGPSPPAGRDLVRETDGTPSTRRTAVTTQENHPKEHTQEEPPREARRALAELFPRGSQTGQRSAPRIPKADTARALEDPRVQRVLASYCEAFDKPATWKPTTRHNGKVRAIAVLDALDGRGGHDRAYDEDELAEAVRGCRSSDFHVRGGHTDIELIVRPGKIERFIAEGRAGAGRRGIAPPAAHEEHDNLNSLVAWQGSGAEDDQEARSHVA